MLGFPPKFQDANIAFSLNSRSNEVLELND